MVDKDTVILEGLLDSIDCSDREKFSILLKDIKPRDCIFGDLNMKKIVFVFDLSGSMTQEFEINGEVQSRLDLLKSSFSDAFPKFTEEQSYNIITFSSNAQFLHTTIDNDFLIKATEENKAKTLEKVSHLSADGYTNIGVALKLALEIKENIDSIIFFSDGAPTVGLTSKIKISKFVEKMYKKREESGLNKPPININLLMLGGEESEEERQEAIDIVSDICNRTGGNVKFFNKYK